MGKGHVANIRSDILKYLYVPLNQIKMCAWLLEYMESSQLVIIHYTASTASHYAQVRRKMNFIGSADAMGLSGLSEVGDYLF